MLNKEITKKKLCELTKTSMEALINSIENKKNPKIDDIILLWSARDFYNEECENNQEDKEGDESTRPEIYI